jgi:gamma-glutamylcyclotransferase (GGCT)/AIG2-like uncharacterized protein YtfP
MDITTDNNIIVAAYGTLREGFGNNRLIPAGCHIGTGQTKEKYTLRANGIPFVSKDPLHNVIVDVYKIDEPTLERLDGLEGHPEWYCREQIPVIVDNETITAWLYFNESYNHLNIINSGDYKNQ